MNDTLEQFGNNLGQAVETKERQLPPVHKWHPPLSGDIDIVIKRSGQWFHEGEPIKRQTLVTLFASILKREGSEYFLVTPIEKWRIRVEDVPFFINRLEIKDDQGTQSLLFESTTGDKVEADQDHPLRVAVSAAGEPSPYLMIRGGMEGLLSRPVYYQLADIVVPGPNQQSKVHGVYSGGLFFALE